MKRRRKGRRRKRKERKRKKRTKWCLVNSLWCSDWQTAAVADVYTCNYGLTSIVTIFQCKLKNFIIVTNKRSHFCHIMCLDELCVVWPWFFFNRSSLIQSFCWLMWPSPLAFLPWKYSLSHTCNVHWIITAYDLSFSTDWHAYGGERWMAAFHNAV